MLTRPFVLPVVFCLSLLFLMLLPSSHLLAQTLLTPTRWHQMMNQAHPQLQALEQEQRVARARTEVMELELSPTLSMTLQQTSDGRPTAIPSMLGNKTLQRSLEIGVSQKYGTGTQIKLTHIQSYQRVYGTITSSEYPYSGHVGILVSQDLWQNRFGRLTSVQRQKERTLARLKVLAAMAEQRAILQRGEAAYWRLLQIQTELRFRQQALGRAQRLLGWTRERLSKQLATPSDLHQMEAAVASKKLEIAQLESRAHSERLELEQFVPEIAQQLMPAGPYQLPDEVELPSALLIQCQGPAADPPQRIDLAMKAIEQSLQEHMTEEAKEKLKPALSLFASYATNSQHAKLWENSFHASETHSPTTAIGVQLTATLDLSLKKRLRAAEDLATQTKQMQATYARTQSALTWQQLCQQQSDLMRQITLVHQLQAVQTRKYQHEEALLQSGRSSTFQVKTFEQEMEDTKLLRLNLQIAAAQLASNKILYVTEQEIAQL